MFAGLLPELGPEIAGHAQKLFQGLAVLPYLGRRQVNGKGKKS